MIENHLHMNLIALVLLFEVSYIDSNWMKCHFPLEIIYRKIVKGTEQFFGLGESEEDAHLIQRKWTQRRHRHYSKRYGRPVAEAPQDGVDSAPPQRPPLSSVCSIKSIQEDPGLVRTFSRRQSVASMAWKGLRSKMGAGAGMVRNQDPVLQSMISLIPDKVETFLVVYLWIGDGFSTKITMLNTRRPS